jgi:diadenosine tetraphosphate (Ap4A) HIT family hydrolase
MKDKSLEQTECLSCAIVQGLKQPSGGTIVENDFFHAHQDIAYPLPGMVILAAKRHIRCLDELTAEEAKDYINLLCRIRKAQREVLKIERVYYFYNEDTTHHFHMWMIPRYEWMNEFGRSIESVRPILVYTREHMNDEENVAYVKSCVQNLRSALSR